MAETTTRARLRRLQQYIPFSAQTLWVLLAVGLVYFLLRRPELAKNDLDTDAFRPFMTIMGKTALWFLAVITGVSLLSTLIVWLHFLWLRKSRNAALQLDFRQEDRPSGRARLFLHAMLQGVRRPLLGFVKVRLLYDQGALTDTFTLLSNQRGQNRVFREAIAGKSQLLLPDIREYELRGAFIFFEDMLRIISLPVYQPAHGHFYQTPLRTEAEDLEVLPRHSETMDVRIDQLRPTEGEYLNYKNFEAGDDVRRIVWQVYARNRELVVRIPERMEPFASHLYFYASFASNIGGQKTADLFLREMLNHYKNRVWTVFDTLAGKEFELRYQPDQELNLPEALNDRERALRIISNSRWLFDNSVRSYFNPRKGAVLVVSSLTAPEELAELLEQCDAGTLVYWVRLSDAFRHFLPWSWLQRLLFLPPDDRLRRIRGRWIFSGLRRAVLRQERQLETLLQNSEVTVAVV